MRWRAKTVATISDRGQRAWRPRAKSTTLPATKVVRAPGSVTMQQALSALQDRLIPAEEIFFAWLIRASSSPRLSSGRHGSTTRPHSRSPP